MSGMRHMLLAGVLALAGCGVGSINPALSDDDARFNADLLGTWQSDDGTESAVITRGNKNDYAIVYTEKDKAARFLARSGYISGRRVLDVWPDVSTASGNDSFTTLLVPLHTVLFIDAVGSEVRFTVFNADSIQSLLERNPDTIANIPLEDFRALSAATPDVQKFIADAAGRPGFIQAPTVWTRKVGATAP